MKKIEIHGHHTAMYAKDDVAHQFDAVNKSHKARWNGKTKSKMGYYVGYHYLIERDGVERQARGDLEVGAHNNKGLRRIGAWMYSANHFAIGFSFAGNMSRQQLTQAQINTAVRLVERLQQKHNIKNEDVTPHRAWSATQCPGNNIPDNMWDYLKEMATKPKEEPEIIKWNKKHKLIEKWKDNPTEDDIKLGYVAKKIYDIFDKRIKKLEKLIK